MGTAQPAAASVPRNVVGADDGRSASPQTSGIRTRPDVPSNPVPASTAGERAQSALLTLGAERMIDLHSADGSGTDCGPTAVALHNLSWSIDTDIRAAHAAFLKRCGATPFDTAAWIEACKAAAPDRDYAFVTATDRRGAIAALFPFAKRSVLGTGVLTWAAQDWADYCMPTLDHAILPDVTTADAEALLASAVATSGLAPDALCLRKHPETTAGRPNAFFSLDGFQYESDSGHHLNVGAEWPTLFKTKMSKRSQQTLRRKRRKLENIGAVDFARPSSEAQADTWAALMISWKRAQVRQRGGSDHFADPAGMRVIEASIRSKAGQVFALTLDERPIAICYTIEAETPAGPTRLLYQTAIDMDGPVAASPGVLLLNELLEMSCRDGFEWFDFGMGDEAYKAQWAEASLALSAVHRAVTARGLPVVSLLKAEFLARRFVKSRPGLFDRVTAIRARAGAALRR